MHELEYTKFEVLEDADGKVLGICNDYSNNDVIFRLHGNFLEEEKREYCELICSRLKGDSL